MGLFNYLKKKFSVEEKNDQNKEEIKEKKSSDVDENKKILANKEAYVKGLKKSNVGFMSRLKSLTSVFHSVNEEYFSQLEEILIEADVGVTLALDIIDRARKEAKINNITDPKKINELLVEIMFQGYESVGNNISADIRFVDEGPTVLLVVGVNGAGKTTTIAKLANKYKNQGKKTLLVAGDTFRAGAVEQLKIWADRIGVDILTGKPNSDPASLCYDGLYKAKSENYDLVIVDTAGRLQTKTNLMDELAKMRRVMGKVIPTAPHETFLIVDANTGQNGVIQAKKFKQATPLTGIVITKMDGTSKGGIILAIRDQLGIPVRFIGLGEAMDDLKEFDLDSYLYGLLIGDEKNV
ncbi:MAG: signal recognition particle-docking protein FtsY [Bacilli bacterium]